MESSVSVPIPTVEFVELITFLQDKKIDLDPVQAVRNAIQYWLESLDWQQEDMLPSKAISRSQGYSWKYKDDSIFLPTGTEIRMFYKGKYHYAKVEGDDILYEGKSLSPSLLANTISTNANGLGSRNAWRDLWLKRPWEREWVLADECRKAARAMSKELGI